MNSRRRSQFFGMLLALGVALLAAPAGATSIYTIDGNGNGTNETKKGADDLDFSFNGSLGQAHGSIRAIDLADTSAADLESQIAGYADFSGGSIALDFETMDVLVFDVVLAAGSAPLDAIGVSVGNDPIGDPAGAGHLSGRGESPDDISLEAGIAGLFPGATIYGYGENTLSSDNLEARERTQRLFVTWDAGLETGQTAVFMLSSGLNANAQALLTDEPGSSGKGGKGKGPKSLTKSLNAAPVPEPGTALLLGLGLAGLVLERRRRR